MKKIALLLLIPSLMTGCSGSDADIASAIFGGITGIDPDFINDIADEFVPSEDKAAGGVASNCKTSNTYDVWLNKRLSCLNKNEQLIKVIGEKGSKYVDKVFTLEQQAFDNNVQNILANNASRFYPNMVCIRNVPDFVYVTEKSLTDLAGYLSLAFGLGNTVKVNGISISPVKINGFTNTSTNETINAVSTTTCDTNKHPLVLDYSTGNIISVNESALANVTETTIIK